MISDAELYALLSHPDSLVRAWADLTREFRANGWRVLLTGEYAADLYHTRLLHRLQEIGS